MVINNKHLLAIFLLLVVIQFSLSHLFETTIFKKRTAFYKQYTSLLQLEELQKKYSKKAQKKELKRIEDFLSMLNLKYSLKTLNDKQELSLQIPADKAQKIINFIFNRNITISAYEIIKKSKETIFLKVVIL